MHVAHCTRQDTAGNCALAQTECCCLRKTLRGHVIGSLALTQYPDRHTHSILLARAGISEHVHDAVALAYHGKPGRQVRLADTLKGCRAILDGAGDALPESAFYMVGSFEEAQQKGAA